MTSRAWDCTLFQYIGELCRYLVNTPRRIRAKRAHRLRLCCGNGLRADVWEAFKERFRIPQILEFYAATEGNFSLFNVRRQARRDRPVPLFLAHRFPVALVKFDIETGEPLRDDEGILRPLRAERDRRSDRQDCRVQDRLQAAVSRAIPASAETQKKILRNVFATRRRVVSHRRSDAQG